MVSLLNDAQDFSCCAVKVSHAVLLCRMEQGEIGDYGCTDHFEYSKSYHNNDLYLL